MLDAWLLPVKITSISLSDHVSVELGEYKSHTVLHVLGYSRPTCEEIPGTAVRIGFVERQSDAEGSDLEPEFLGYVRIAKNAAKVRELLDEFGDPQWGVKAIVHLPRMRIKDLRDELTATDISNASLLLECIGESINDGKLVIPDDLPESEKIRVQIHSFDLHLEFTTNHTSKK